MEHGTFRNSEGVFEACMGLNPFVFLKYTYGGGPSKARLICLTL